MSPTTTTSRPTPKHAATTAPERMAAELAYLRNECHSIRYALDRRAELLDATDPEDHR